MQELPAALCFRVPRWQREGKGEGGGKATSNWGDHFLSSTFLLLFLIHFLLYLLQVSCLSDSLLTLLLSVFSY